MLHASNGKNYNGTQRNKRQETSISPIENIWRIIKRKMRQRRPKTVEQLEACIRQEWDNIPIPKLEQLVSSVPRPLQTVIKRRGDATQW